MRLPARVITVVVALVVVLSGLTPSQAAPERRDSWSGLAFDACQAPSQRAMDAWWRSSPFSGIGIYIGGIMRACSQPHLTERWVRAQTRTGWRMLPIWVGPQATCTGYRHRISAARGVEGRYFVARAQGTRAAKGAVHAARQLGLGRGTTLWYDLEYFPVGNTRCRHAALSFLSNWTLGVRRAGYRSGVYSSVSAAIDALDGAARSFVKPDRIWFAWANGRADSHIDPKWVRADWKRDQRVHQYRLDHVARYGGVRLAIDSNYVRLGKHPAGARVPAGCGEAANRRSYSPLKRGSRGPQVDVLRCLLGEPRSGHAFGDVLFQRVLTFQVRHGITPTGRVNQRTWASLLADGSRRLVKRGSTGAEVRKLQRALNAVLRDGPRITGYFGPGTTDAVKRYQSRLRHARTGVVTPRTWRALSQGLLGNRTHAHRGEDAAEHDGKKKRHSTKHRGKKRHGKKHHGKRSHQR
ncbi:MAG TPA: glycoside hydrolase domain-containing protein [Nocardioidaceae bacterium]|nr:glycoside hydrolase domain-containing protein [Nocardioidaceae bacterium]